jgi:hypothetical protein
MHKHFLASVVLLSFCLGCGTGEYESRIGGHRGGGGGGGGAAAADPLGPAEDLPGTRVSIRVPQCVTLVPEGTDPRRSLPMPLLPGTKRTYEGFVKDSQEGEIPFYCTFLVVETAKLPGQNLVAEMEKWLNALSKATGGKAGQSVDIHVTNADGKDVTWKMMHLGAPTEFYYRDKGGKESYRSMDGIIEAYLHEEGGYYVIVGWRLPSNIEQNVGNAGLAELAKAVAGGVAVRPQ